MDEEYKGFTIRRDGAWWLVVTETPEEKIWGRFPVNGDPDEGVSEAKYWIDLYVQQHGEPG